ncbi:MAG TPA: ATP-binding protein [Bacteroidota bacterium]|nr:ATP-binding protein [Bacteroidota bacterium]
MSETDPTQGENDNVAERNAGYLRALDLHDETGQILTAILVNLQRIGGIATGSDVGETVRDTQHLVETLFYSIRNFIRDSAGVAPARSLPPPELGPALRRLTQGFSRRTGIEVDLRYDPDTERVPGEHKAVFYRVVQESLTNVFRHSGARRVTIRFSRSESSVDLEIGDDGGSRPAPGPPGLRPERAGTGSGLRGMRERVRIVGGECTVRMVENRGMTVKVVLPYNIS